MNAEQLINRLEREVPEIIQAIVEAQSGSPESRFAYKRLVRNATTRRVLKELCNENFITLFAALPPASSRIL